MDWKSESRGIIVVLGLGVILTFFGGALWDGFGSDGLWGLILTVVGVAFIIWSQVVNNRVVKQIGETNRRVGRQLMEEFDTRRRGKGPLG